MFPIFGFFRYHTRQKNTIIPDIKVDSSSGLGMEMRGKNSKMSPNPYIALLAHQLLRFLMGERKQSSDEEGKTISDASPKTASAYLDPRYWDERFSGEDHYEWFKDYSHFQHLIRRHLQPTDSVLELGCGNSRLCEELLKDGITDITCIDLSAVAVERMQKRLSAEGIQGIKVLEADMLDLPFSSECFDVVIEKGTMDVLFVDSGDPWNPHPAAVNKVMKMLEGVYKVLKPKGTFISISFGQPHFRRRLFESPSLDWSVNWSTFGEGFHYFFYTLKKGRRMLESDVSFSVPSMTLMHEELEREDFIFRTAVDVLE